ncbi:response regulator [Oceanobacillus kimchii]|uniref:DNA-binding response regulator n=1 Tax=Oceanobacillus kimchii TaxID=746691 RepID=A0ABQ5TPW2_9BACI|nr:response regulator transcription factor [Oceanobacillus kimchii]GLO67859.1 DNA-binding response regulator [Oceanobacillus kimchii]
MIKVLIADDHHVVRRGLVMFLKTQPPIKIVGEASNGQEAIELTQSHKPDIILMDIMMPVMNGIEATRKIRSLFPEVKILMLTSFSEQNHVIPALEAGASGYQLKDIQPDDLINSIISLMDGQTLLHPKVTNHLMPVNSIHHPSYRLNTLTNRETEVLKEIAKGKSNKEIAISLFITEKTVKTHINKILSKLDLSDRTQAALFAVKHQVISND